MPATLGCRAASVARVLRNRNLVKLVTSFGIWIASDWAVLVLLSVAAFRTGGSAAVGVVGVLRIVPAALAVPFGAWIADRVSRSQFLSAAHVCWAVLAALMALNDAMGASFSISCCLLALMSLISAGYRGAVNACIPQVVNESAELASANALYGLLEGAGTVIGPLLAGAALAVAEPGAGFAAVGLLNLFAAVLSSNIISVFKPARVEVVGGLQRLRAISAGFTALLGTPVQRGVFFASQTQCVMRGLVNVFVVTACVTIFGLGESGAGPLFAAIGVGGLLGSLGLVGATTRRAAVPFLAGVALWGFPIVLIALFPNAVFAWFALLLLGVGNAVEDVFGFTILNRSIGDDVAARAFGAFWASAAISVAVGSLLAPALISILGLSMAMACAGAAVAVIPLLLARTVRRADDRPPSWYDDLQAMQRVEIFAVLNQIALERLVAVSSSVPVSAGHIVVEQGAPAAAFYAVVDGQLSVTVDGRTVGELTAGDCFGEIGLLNRSPRTATVAALTDCRLLSVDGDSFVAAVTTHRTAELRATELAAERLASDSINERTD